MLDSWWLPCCFGCGPSGAAGQWDEAVKAAVDPWAVLRDGVWGATVRTAMAVAIVLLNPFHLNDWSDERSRAIWQQFYAPFYPGSLTFGTFASLSLADLLDRPMPAIPAVSRPGLSNIVVLTSDASWPPRGRIVRQADIIDLFRELKVPQPDGSAPTAAERPQAVFLDFTANAGVRPDLDAVLGKPRPTDEPGRAQCTGAMVAQPELSLCLARAVAAATQFERWKDDAGCQPNPAAKLRCIIDHGGVPILLATTTPATEVSADSALGLLNEMAVLVNITIDDDRIHLGDKRGADTVNRPWSLSAPAALYLVACMQQSARLLKWPRASCAALAGLDWAAPETLAKAAWPAAFDKPLMPVAGLHPRSAVDTALVNIEEGTIDQRCLTADAARSRIGDYLGTLLWPRVVGDHVDGKPPCPYADHLRVNTLLADAEVTPGLMAGRLVLIGDDRPDAKDRHEMPPFARLAGVFVVAMAADNLLEMGSDYHTPLTMTQDAWRTGPTVFAVTLIIGLMIGWFDRCDDEPSRVVAVVATEVLVLVLAVVLILLQPLSATGFNRVLVLMFLFAGMIDLAFSAVRRLVRGSAKSGETS